MAPFISLDDPTPEDMYNLAEEYRIVGSVIEDKRVKTSFLNLSSAYFKKCEKKTKTDELKVMASISSFRNNAYKGKYKKAIKKLLDIDLNKDWKKAQELKNFVLALCYKNEGNFQKVEQLRSVIKDENLLAELKG